MRIWLHDGWDWHLKYIFMARKHHKAAAAWAQAAWAQNITSQLNIIDNTVLPHAPLPLTDTVDIECTSWTRGVIHLLSDSEDDIDEHWTDSESENHSDFNNLVELEGEELVDSLWIKCWHELDLKQLATLTPYESLLHTKTQSDWKTAEARWALGYNGLSKHRKWEVSQQIREKDARDKVTCNRWAKTGIACENLLMWTTQQRGLEISVLLLHWTLLKTWIKTWIDSPDHPTHQQLLRAKSPNWKQWWFHGQSCGWWHFLWLFIRSEQC